MKFFILVVSLVAAALGVLQQQQPTGFGARRVAAKGLSLKIPAAWATKDTPYGQLFSMRFQLPGRHPVVAWPTLSFAGPIVQVLDAGRVDGSFLAIVPTGLMHCQFPFANQNNTGLPPPPLSCLALDAGVDSSYRAAVVGSNVVAVGPTSIRVTPFGGGPRTIAPCQLGAVASVAVDALYNVWVASHSGVSRVGNILGGQPEVRALTVPVLPATCTGVSVAATGHLVAAGLNCGTYGAMLRFALNGSSVAHDFRHEYTPGVIDETPKGLAFAPDGSLWIADNVVHRQEPHNESIRIHRFGPLEDLPRNGSTCISVTDKGTVWVGTGRGLLRFGQRFGASSGKTFWKALLGGRWLPGKLEGSPTSSSFFEGQRVSSVAALAVKAGALGPNRKPLIEAVVVATDGGISVVTTEQWTLREKADFLEDHMRPRHLRFGLTDDAVLKEFGDILQWKGFTSDNDGLHTAGYLLSQAYRFAVTKNPEAQTRGLDALNALLLLNQVTGIKGYAARSVVKVLPPHIGGQWYPSPTMPSFIFKGNTSSDEITGHLAAYPLAYDLLATTPAEKKLARDLHENMLRYIVDHNYTLIGYNGHRTRWGVWNPDLLNNDPEWEDERGLNAAGLMGWLAAGYHLSNSSYYQQHFDNLYHKHGFGINLENLKINNPADFAFFDDHLGQMELRNLMYYQYGRDPSYDVYIDKAVRQWYPRGLRAQLTPDIVLYALWAAAAQGGANPPSAPVDDIVLGAQVLQDWPLDTIKYPSYNQDRWDIQLDPQWTNPLSRHALPRDEHTAMMWAHDGFTLNGGSGFSAANPKDYLMAYWMAVYHGVIV